MSKRTLINLLMLVMILALGTVAWLRPGLEQPPAATLTPLNTLDIDRITWHSGAETLHFDRAGDTWWLNDAPRIPADNLQVQRLADLARARPARSYAASEMDLGQLGLGDQAAELTLNDIVIRIGGTDALNQLRYVQTGERVYLIKDTVQHFLGARRTQFASRQLLPPGSRIASLALPDFAVNKNDQGNWQATPEDHAASADDWGEFVQHWENARAMWVRRYQAGTAWTGTITLTLADGSEVSYQLARQDQDVVLGRDDWHLEYHMGPAAGEQLLAEQPAQTTPNSELPAPDSPGS